MQRFGGISRYFFELMNHFDKSDEVEFTLSMAFSNNVYLDGAVYSNHRTFFKRKEFKGKTRLLLHINRIQSKNTILKQEFDILHPTYYDPYFLSCIGDKPFVLTIYDMIHEVYPQLFPKWDKTPEWKKAVIQKAAKICALSENTKRDIIKLFNIDEEKIKVIHLSSSIKKKNHLRNLDIELPENYILFVGARVEYKNFRFFVRAIADLLKEDESLKVVCAGGGAFSSAEIQLFKELGIRNKLFHYQVDDDTLACLYANARVFVFPSLYEGFGMPILESFSNGCPVALSKASSFPEVAGDAGLYFNPKDGASIKRAVEKAIADEDTRKKLVAKGYERMKKFSGIKAAEETLAVYKSIPSKWI